MMSRREEAAIVFGRVIDVAAGLGDVRGYGGADKEGG